MGVSPTVSVPQKKVKTSTRDPLQQTWTHRAWFMDWWRVLTRLGLGLDGCAGRHAWLGARGRLWPPLDMFVAIVEEIVAFPRRARTMQVVAGGRGGCGDGYWQLLKVAERKVKSMKLRSVRSLSSCWPWLAPHFSNVFFRVRGEQFDLQFFWMYEIWLDRGLILKDEGLLCRSAWWTK